MSNTNTNPTPLTQAEAAKIAQAYARLRQLQEAVIKQAKDEAEVKGLVEFLAHSFLEHASEFIGCYFVMHNEYEPILGLIGQVTRRVCGILNNQAAQQQAAIAKDQEAGATVGAASEPSKIVNLDGNPAAQ